MGRLRLAFVILAQILVLQAMADESGRQLELKTQTGAEPPETWAKFADQPVSGAPESSGEQGESKAAEAPEIRRLGKHHSSDKSVAGGGVIIGGLVTAIFAAVFCYIRVTRKRDGGR